MQAPRKPKVLERRPDPPPPARGTPFQIDEKLARSASSDGTDKWLETAPGRLFLGVGYAVLALFALAGIAVAVLLWITFPDTMGNVLAGIGVFVLITFLAPILAKPSGSPKRD